MRYIQNEELREWIKDNLRKTIFQKAHALSIQTGCEILIKLHDVTNRKDADSHQYLATGSLHKAYKGNSLRKHIKDKLVSGETGLPQNEYVDQGVQSGDSSEGAISPVDAEGGVPTHDSFTTDQSQQYIANDDNDGIPLPLHLTVSNEPSASGNEIQETNEALGGGHVAKDHEQVPMDVKIKVEKVEDELQETTMISETSDSNAQNTDSFTDFQQHESMNSASGFVRSMQDDNELVGRYSIPMSPKPYQCAMCGKAFRSVQVLQKHTRTFHFRPQGSSGGQGFSKGQGLMGSSRGQTAQMKRYQCVMCSRSFPNPDLLTDHMSRSHMNTQSATSQAAALTFATTNSSAPSTATAPYNTSNTQGPFHLTESSTINQSQPSTSSAMLQPAPVWPIAPSSFTFQKKKTVSASPYRFPRVGRPSGSALGSGTKSQGTPPKMDGEFRKSFWVRGSTSYEIMSSLLRCSGPVSTFTAFTQSGPPKLRSISKQAYNGAVEELQAAQLGTVVSLDQEGSLSTPGRSPIVFVKSHPDVTTAILDAGLYDMCTPEVYVKKYEKKVPAKISRVTRHKLVSLGYVTVDQML